MNTPTIERGVPLPEPKFLKKEFLAALNSGDSFAVPKEEAEQWRVTIWGDSQFAKKFISRTMDENTIRFWKK